MSALIAVGFLWSFSIQGASLDDLQERIRQKNAEIQKLSEEARRYRAELLKEQERGRTLQQEISRIERTIQAIAHDIRITTEQIEKTKLEIEELQTTISEKERQIEKLKQGMGSLAQALFEQERISLLEAIAKYPRLSGFFRFFEHSVMAQERMFFSLEAVKNLRKDLAATKDETERKRSQWEEEERLLNSRKHLQNDLKKERTSLLSDTKKQEKKYQELLREQELMRSLLEKEISQIEAQIQITIDPSSLPAKGRGVLGAPLPRTILQTCRREAREESNNCLTQFFGYTSFAAIGGYQGKGHNGIDLRAEIGTPVLAAAEGTITAVGNTDAGCPRASYGQWILIRHPNNLSTLYAHLSSIDVAAGATVRRGERIGLSGKSGYATGPHLHFGLFATQAVKIESIRSRVCGRLMTLPIAPHSGYLNPLDYL